MNRNIVAVDLDNTIAIYDFVVQAEFAKAVDHSADISPTSKKAVAEYFISRGAESQWTELQGRLYGPLMRGAQVATGFLSFVEACGRSGKSIEIVSQRTLHSSSRERYPLRDYANKWIEEIRFKYPSFRSVVFAKPRFFEVKNEKIQHLMKENYFAIIDDLPSVLNPVAGSVESLLVCYAPDGVSEPTDHRIIIARSWDCISKIVLNSR